MHSALSLKARGPADCTQSNMHMIRRHNNTLKQYTCIFSLSIYIYIYIYFYGANPNVQHMYRNFVSQFVSLVFSPPTLSLSLCNFLTSVDADCLNLLLTRRNNPLLWFTVEEMVRLWHFTPTLFAWPTKVS